MLNISMNYTRREPCMQQLFAEAEDMRGKEPTKVGLGNLGLDIGQYCCTIHDKLKVVRFMTACR